MFEKIFVVEYLVDKDNKKQYEKKIFNEFKEALKFCKRLRKEKKFYLISKCDKKL